MNRLSKLFFYVYPGVLSAPTSVQYYDLAKVERPDRSTKTEVTSATSQKSSETEWTHAVIRNVQKPWWRKAQKPSVAA